MKTETNKVQLTGFAGTNPVVINLENEKKIARLRLAVNESYKKASGEEVKQTHWFNLLFWNAKAELVEQMVKKGVKISVAGKLNVNDYTDKNGHARSATDIVVQEIELIEKAEKSEY